MAETIAQTEGGAALESTTVWINRTSTTIKGGRRLGFAALVVVGDRQASVGLGYGKGRGVPTAIEKAQKEAKKNLFKVNTNKSTLPHGITGRHLASKVRLLPAAPGTGVIAGGTVRAVLEMAGVQDCLTKAYGSTNQMNLSKAVISGLQSLRTREEVADLRGVNIESSTVDEVLHASQELMEAAESEKAAPLRNQQQGAGGKGKAKGEKSSDQKGSPQPGDQPSTGQTDPTQTSADVKKPEHPPSGRSPGQPQGEAGGGSAGLADQPADPASTGEGVGQAQSGVEPKDAPTPPSGDQPADQTPASDTVSTGKDPDAEPGKREGNKPEDQS